MAIVNVINYTCAFHTMECKNVLGEKNVYRKAAFSVLFMMTVGAR